MTSYGIWRVAAAQLNYQAGPPASRTPPVAELTFTDHDFVLFR